MDQKQTEDTGIKVTPYIAREIAKRPQLLATFATGDEKYNEELNEFYVKLLRMEEAFNEALKSGKVYEDLYDKMYKYRQMSWLPVYGGRRPDISGKTKEERSAAIKKTIDDFYNRDIRMQPLPESVMEGRPQAPLGYTTAHIERALRLKQANLRDAMIAESTAEAQRKERESRLKHLTGIERNPSMPESTFGKYKPENNTNERALGNGTIATIDPKTHSIALSWANNPEHNREYLARVAKQMGRSKPYQSFEEFEADQKQRLAENKARRDELQYVKDLAKYDALQGKEPPLDATPEYLRIYNNLRNSQARRGLHNTLLSQRASSGDPTPQQIAQAQQLYAMAPTPQARLEVAKTWQQFVQELRAGAQAKADNAFREKQANRQAAIDYQKSLFDRILNLEEQGQRLLQLAQSHENDAANAVGEQQKQSRIQAAALRGSSEALRRHAEMLRETITQMPLPYSDSDSDNDKRPTSLATRLAVYRSTNPYYQQKTAKEEKEERRREAERMREEEERNRQQAAAREQARKNFEQQTRIAPKQNEEPWYFFLNPMYIYRR